MFELFSSFTPLYVASEMGQLDVVQSLLGAGADMNLAALQVSDVILCQVLHIQCTCILYIITPC